VALEPSLAAHDGNLNAQAAAILASLAGQDPAAIWHYVPRTLTATGAATQAAMRGQTLEITIAISFSHTLTQISIPATWTKLYLTAKQNLALPDAASILQLVVSNPADVGDGLLRIEGGGATLAWGRLIVNPNTVRIILDDDATSLFSKHYGLSYDLKALTMAGESVLVRTGTMNIDSTPTRAIT